MALDPLHRDRQIKAIDIALATAPKIQEDLKEKFGYGENIFFNLDLVEYRINTSYLDIAEDLDVKSRYEIESDGVARDSIGRAFRGHHDEEFMSDYRFDGLFGKEMNDYIKKIKDVADGRIGGLIAGLIGGRASVETHGDQMRNGGLIGGRKGGLNRMASLTPEEKSELGRKGGLKSYKLGNGIHGFSPEERIESGRKGALAQGFHVWSLEEIADIHNFREESIGKGYRKNQPSWDYTTAEMNKKYDEDWTTNQVERAYNRNKDKLPDEEE